MLNNKIINDRVIDFIEFIVQIKNKFCEIVLEIDREFYRCSEIGVVI